MTPPLPINVGAFSSIYASEMVSLCALYLVPLNDRLVTSSYVNIFNSATILECLCASRTKSLLFDNSEMAELAYCDIHTLLNYNNGYFSRFLM